MNKFRNELKRANTCLLHQVLIWMRTGEPIIDFMRYRHANIFPADFVPSEYADEASTLCGLLSDGKITAKGVFWTDEEFVQTKIGLTLRDDEQIDIPPIFWDFDEIDWPTSYLNLSPEFIAGECPERATFFVLIDADELNRFAASIGFTLMPAGGSTSDPGSLPRIRLEDERREIANAQRNLGGRPPKHAWHEFYEQVISLANRPDGLPERQSDLINIMAQWCHDTWGDEPASSLLRDKVSRIYRKL